jgi:glycosyltransferase involved in cell wall biosynthesis
LLIVGEGGLAEQLGAAGDADIRLVGRVDDVELFGLLRSATCFVFSTKGEGMPTAILEAMSCSLPVIASDVGAVAELVSSDNGWLVSPGDIVELHRALTQAVTADARMLAAMGEVSRRRAEQFAWPRIAEQTVEVLSELSARPRDAPSIAVADLRPGERKSS